MSFNTSLCPGTSGISILPSQNATVCGIRSLQANLAPCCGNAEIKTYQCQQYCSTTSSMLNWQKCLTDKTNTSYIADAFCQAQITGNVTETLGTSFASSSPRASFLLIFLALSTLLFAGVDAVTVPSLAGGVARRQSTQLGACTITEISPGYTTTRNNTVRVTAELGCSSDLCDQGTDVDTGILNNNRTINGASASEAKYDAFFDLAHNKTGHWFPALSKSALHYSWLSPRGTTGLEFTPFAWCVDATATGCGDVLNGNNASTPVAICGPDFVEDPTESTLPSASIQGVFSVFTTY